MTRRPPSGAAHPPLAAPPANVRQRRRASGDWRVWWEPTAAARAAGMAPVDLDPADPARALRMARDLNRKAARAGKAPKPQPRGRTITDLIDDYQGSPHWTDALRPKTRESYRRLMSLIDRKWGPTLVADFTRPVMVEWYETLYRASGQWQAVALIRMMSILFDRAERIGWRPENTNPCLRLKARVPAPRRRVASWAEIDALVAAADAADAPSLALAVLLSALQGQRQTDVLGATAGQFQQGRLPGAPETGSPGAACLVWRLTRSKRSTEGAMVIHPEVEPRLRAALLRARSRAALAGRNPDAEPVLTDEANENRRFTDDTWQNRWTALRSAAASRGLPDIATLQFRDLRRTFGVLSRAGGASKGDTGDVLGNSAATDPRLGETYMPASFDTASRAVLAIRRPITTDRERKGA